MNYIITLLQKARKNYKNMKTYKTETSLLTIVENNKEYCITCGNYQISPYFKSKQDAEKYIEKRPYELIVNLVCLVIDVNNKNNMLNNELNNNNK